MQREWCDRIAWHEKEILTVVAYFLQTYLRHRPLFLSLIRAREAALFAEEFARGGLARQKGSMLDVGCGDGFFARTLFAQCQMLNAKCQMIKEKRSMKIGHKGKTAKNEVSKYRNCEAPIDVGLDLPGSRMGEAEKLGIYKKLVTFDGVHIPFKNNTFQTIISNCVLEHVEDLPSLLKEIYRVLKPGGKFITTVMAEPWEDNLAGSLIIGRWYRDWMRKKQVHRNLLTKTEWPHEFSQSGFRVEKAIGYLTPAACRLIDICHYFSVPSLISYKLLGTWVLWPELTKLYPIKWFANILEEAVSTDKSGAIFYVLRKF